MSRLNPEPEPPPTSGVRFELEPLTEDQRRICALEDENDDLRRGIRQARAEASVAELTARTAENEAKQARKETAALSQALEVFEAKVARRFAEAGLRRHDGLPLSPWERGFTVPVQGPGGREWWNPGSGQVEKG